MKYECTSFEQCRFDRKNPASEVILKRPFLKEGRMQYHTTAAWTCKCGNSINLTKVHFMRWKMTDWVKQKLEELVEKFKAYELREY